MTYTIGNVAELLNVTASTLRYYDKEGLLPFVDRSSGGIRVFKEEDFEWLRLIECLKAAGMPIKSIKSFIDLYREGDSTIEQRRDMFYEGKATVEKQIELLKKSLDMLTYKCWFYDTAVASGTTTVPKAMKEEELPDEIRELKKRIDL